MGINLRSILLLSVNLLPFSAPTDTITPSQPLLDGQLLISAAGTFALGFFTAGDPTKRYVGVWYANVPARKVVWVANRKTPISGAASVLSLSADGNLTLLDSAAGNPSWSTNTSGLKNPSLKLLESGNAVLTAGSTILWQSFDFPADVLLPGMEIGWDLTRKLEKRLTAWKSDDDPSPGTFSYRLKLTTSPEMVMWNGSTPEYRTGPWDDGSWSGVLPMKANSYFTFQFEKTPDRIYYSYETVNDSVLSTLTVTPAGLLERLVLLAGEWRRYWRMPQDQCDIYGTCGVYTVCQIGDVDQDQCQCLKGFEPLSAADWGMRDYSGGCMRKTSLGCGSASAAIGPRGGAGGDGVKVSGVKPPESTKRTTVVAGVEEEGCEAMCLKNCSCMAFAVVGGNCIIWPEELLDIKEFPTGGEEVFIRLAASDLGQYFFHWRA